jgi:hypothetical protein
VAVRMSAKLWRGLEGGDQGKPDEVEQAQGAAAAAHPGACGGLGESSGSEAAGEGADILLTEIVPYSTPDRVDEDGVLLTIDCATSN